MILLWLEYLTALGDNVRVLRVRSLRLIRRVQHRCNILGLDVVESRPFPHWIHQMLRVLIILGKVCQALQHSQQPSMYQAGKYSHIRSVGGQVFLRHSLHLMYPQARYSIICSAVTRVLRRWLHWTRHWVQILMGCS